MRPPSMRCSATGDCGLLLRHPYMSQPYPLQYGIVKSVASDQYRPQVMVEPVETHCSNVSDSRPVSSIKEVESLCTMNRQRSTSLVTNLSRFKASTRPDALPLTVAAFCRAFPFHLMFNRRLEIVQAGIALLRLLRCSDTKSFMFADYFTVMRPDMTFTFSAVLARINTVFVITTKPGVVCLSTHMRHCGDAHQGETGTQCQRHAMSCPLPHGSVTTTAGVESDVDASDCMNLKGQMIYVRESDCVLFLCSPRVSTLADLGCKGLYLSDIPLHDATRDLILMTHARRAERELIEKLEETSSDLKKLEVRLNEDKQRTDSLLHSILPWNVAARLRLNKPVEAEKYNVVTILFADIVQFTTMCGNELVEPMDIVRVLNRLYTQFDMLSTLNEVYKVETIGDAYMVVGGLPTFTPYHADRIVSMAFGMVQVCQRVLSPVDQKPLQVRIGVHSGPCVAGVVGRKMPRYCLFGQTVAIASKMESLSQPQRTNISDEAKRHLSNPFAYIFEKNNSKHDLVDDCYFVSAASNFPHPVTMDLNLPVPRGMFRTPNPSPAVSRAPSPVGSSLATLGSDNPTESICSFKVPDILIGDTDDNSDEFKRQMAPRAESFPTFTFTDDLSELFTQDVIRGNHRLCQDPLPKCCITDADLDISPDVSFESTLMRRCWSVGEHCALRSTLPAPCPENRYVNNPSDREKTTEIIRQNDSFCETNANNLYISPRKQILSVESWKSSLERIASVRTAWDSGFSRGVNAEDSDTSNHMCTSRCVVTDSQENREAPPSQSNCPLQTRTGGDLTPPDARCLQQTNLWFGCCHAHRHVGVNKIDALVTNDFGDLDEDGSAAASLDTASNNNRSSRDEYVTAVTLAWLQDTTPSTSNIKHLSNGDACSLDEHVQLPATIDSLELAAHSRGTCNDGCLFMSNTGLPAIDNRQSKCCNSDDVEVAHVSRTLIAETVTNATTVKDSARCCIPSEISHKNAFREYKNGICASPLVNNDAKLIIYFRGRPRPPSPRHRKHPVNVDTTYQRFLP